VKINQLLQLLLVLLFCSSQSMAQAFYGNQSHLEYKSADTRYFSLHFPHELQMYADPVAQMAETVSDTLLKRYNIEMPRLDVVLQDGLFSNGQANSAKHGLKLWVSDWGFKLRSTHPWLQDVITHEFAHIVSLYAGAKTKPWLFGLHLGYQDFYNEDLVTDWGFVLSTGLASAWLAEGTAQYESARLGFDRWDSHRDMVIRTAALNDQFISLDLMNVFQSDLSIDLERGPYTQGFDLIRYISEEFGDKKVIEIWTNLGEWGQWSTEGAIATTLGISADSLFENYKENRKKKYKAWESKKTFSNAVKVSSEGYWTSNLRRDKQNNIWGYSNFGGPTWDGSLFKWSSKIDSTKNQYSDSLGAYSLSAYAVENLKLEKTWLDNGFDLFHTADSVSHLLTVGYKKRDKNGQAHFNLLSYDIKNKETKYLTKDLDLRHPSLSKDQDFVALVKKQAHRNRFVLGEYSFKDSTYKDLWLPSGKESASFQIFKPVYSKDGQRILFTWYDQNICRISEYNKETKEVTHLLEGGADLRDATYFENKIVYSADYDGVFNVYFLDLDSKEINKVTQVMGGAFEAQIIEEYIHYVDYDKSGFNWYKIKRENKSLAKVVYDGTEASFKTNSMGLNENFGISAKAKSYNAIPRKVVVAPLLIGQESPTNTESNKEGESRYKVGASFSISDPIDENIIDGVLLLEVGEGFDYINGNGINPAIQRDFSLGWTNKSTPVNFNMTFMAVNMRGQDSLKSEDPSIATTLTHYSNLFMNLHSQLDYDLFKISDKVTLAGGVQNISFNLYEGEAPFSYSVYNAWYTSLAYQIRKFRETNGSAQISPGYGIGAWYKFESSDLFRPNGKFSDSFEVNSAGVVNPIFTPFQIQSLHSDLVYAVPVPLFGGVLSTEVLTQAIIHWESDKADTLDGFFLPGVHVPGYPYLSGEDVLFRGENNIKFAARWNKNLYKLNRGARAFHHLGAWLDVGYHVTSVFDGKFYEGSDDWVQSLHSELRFSNRIFYGIPMEIFGRFEWGFDEWSGYSPDHFYDVSYMPTRIKAGLVFRFDNPGELIDLKPRRIAH
jgi:hypothetical protein